MKDGCCEWSFVNLEGGEKEFGSVGRVNVCEGLEVFLRRLYVIFR